MGIKRIVDIDFWTDNKVVELFSPEDKYFMLYLLTNPHTTQLGIYKYSKRVMAFELGYSVEAVAVLLDRFETKYEMIEVSKITDELAIRNYLIHSVIKGGKPVEDLLHKEIGRVKDRDLILFAMKDIPKATQKINETVKKIVDIYLNKKNNDNDNDNDDSYHDSYHDSSYLFPEPIDIPEPVISVKPVVLAEKVINHLNEKSGKRYKATTDATKKIIMARNKEGFTLDDFFTVINNMTTKWRGDRKMEEYLRPATLFQASKFEGYLNASTNNGGVDNGKYDRI